MKEFYDLMDQVTYDLGELLSATEDLPESSAKIFFLELLDKADENLDEARKAMGDLYFGF